jgi:L-asparaginase II
LTERFARVARSLRGGWVENVHFGVVAVATPEGDVIASLGDPDQRVFLRSAAKPLQLVPLLAAGGRERFGLTAAEIALMSSSHAGTEAHVAAARTLLERIDGIAEADLVCGVHPPLDRAAAAALESRNERPGVLHNNCCANHIGQLMACVALGWPTRGYSQPGHPLQERVAALIGEFADLAADEIQTGADGCGLPSFCVPAANAARIYARLAFAEGAGLEAETARHVRGIVEAMAEHPEMVAGPGRFTTELIRATGGRLIGKEGAEGFYGVAIRGPAALGVAVKVIDGSESCRDGVVLEVLRQAGCLSKAEFEKLGSFYRKDLVNHSGEITGELAPDLELIEGRLPRAAAASAGA